MIRIVDKYKPILLSDYYFKEGLYNTLNSLIQINILSMLIIGSSGCGKTSIIQTILSEYFKNIEKNVYSQNVLYISSLHEQGINYYRNEVKTFCQTCSTIPNKNKVIIIDNIDFINSQSQQIFRALIDKYKHKVHFIVSCTTLHKVLENLQSRLVIIHLPPITDEIINRIYYNIVKGEQIDITEEAKQLLFKFCNNTIHVLINYLEKCKLLGIGVINKENVINICTDINFEIFYDYIMAIKNNQLYTAITIINNIYDKGYSVIDILDNCFIYIKMTDLLNINVKYDIIQIICKYITIFHDIHEDKIELSLFTNNIYNTIINSKYI